MAFSLSNSYAQPLTHPELIELTLARGDRELVEAYNRHPLGYTSNGGSLDLREQIAAMYGPSITAENILVFPGAQVALQVAACALTNGHTHSIVFDPAYQSTQEAPVHAGSQVTRITLRASNGWQIDPDEVRAAIRENTRYMVINEPYNPAGTLMSRELQSELISIADEHGIYMLSDEVYRLLEHDPADRLPPMADVYKRGISCVTMSKPWGACGVTIGWLAFPDLAIKQPLVDVQYFGTACPSRASELQALMVLRASDAILSKNLAIIRTNLRLLDAFVARYADLFEWVRPKAGAIAFIRFKGPLSSSELGEHLAAVSAPCLKPNGLARRCCARDTIERSRGQAAIGIKPAYCFTDVVTADKDYFRVGFGEEQLPRALEALTRFVESHQHTWRTRSRL
jgi:aspartate/methionine/tyrosine aminotransferase